MNHFFERTLSRCTRVLKRSVAASLAWSVALLCGPAVGVSENGPAEPPVSAGVTETKSGPAGFTGPAEAEQFISHLYGQGAYRGAVIELHRYVYQGNPHSAHARYLLALSYANLDELTRAAVLLRELADDLERGWVAGTDRPETDEFSRQQDPAGHLHQETLVQLMNCSLRMHRFSDLPLLREELSAAAVVPRPELSRYADALLLASQVHEYRWEEAADFFRSSGSAGSLNPELAGLLQQQPPRRFPWLAGLLSVVPGGGHLYAGRPADGARSLLINGALGGLTVLSLVLGTGWLAALFGVVTLAAYAANVYGGVNAALQYNARGMVEMRNRILRMLPVPPFDIIIQEGNPFA